MNLDALLHVLRAHWRGIVVKGCIGAAAAFLLGFLILQYEAQATLLLRPIGFGSESRTLMTEPSLGIVYSPYLEVLQKSGQSYLRLITSRELMERVVVKHELDKPFRGKRNPVTEAIKQPIRLAFFGRTPAIEPSPVQRAVTETQDQVKARLIQASSILEIQVKDKDAKRAALVANGVADAFVDYARETLVEATDRLAQSIDERRKVAQQQVQERRKEVLALKARYGIPPQSDLATERQRIATKLVATEDAIEANQQRLEELGVRLPQQRAKIDGMPEMRRSDYRVDANPRALALRDQLVQQEIAVGQALIEFPESSPMVAAAKAKRDLTEKALRAEVESYMATETFKSDTNRESILAQVIGSEMDQLLLPEMNKVLAARADAYRKQVLGWDEVKTQFQESEAALAAAEQQVSGLVGALQAARAYPLRDFEEVSVVDHAVVPRYPFLRGLPLVAYAILGFIAGSIAGAAQVAHREQASFMGA